MKNIFKLIILSLLCVCFNAHAQVSGTPYILPETCKSTGIISGNISCSGSIISVTSCGCIAGATLNDDLSSNLGKEYDWSGATGYIANNTTTRALVEIAGQCWYRINADRIPSNYNPSPAWNVNSNIGAHGYYTGGPYSNEGRFYQPLAAYNGTMINRGQGICAPGFHIPSVCEWSYLENFIGVSVSNQQNGTYVSSSGTGSVLVSGTYGGTNATGFSLLYTGYYSFSGFGGRGSSNSYADYLAGIVDQWGLGPFSAIVHEYPNLPTGAVGEGRTVRCLAD